MHIWGGEQGPVWHPKLSKTSANTKANYFKCKLSTVSKEAGREAQAGANHECRYEN